MRHYRYTWFTYNGEGASIPINDMEGTLHRVVTYNEDAGTTGPGYDVTLEDETGADCLNGHCLARAWNATQEEFPRFDKTLPDGRQFTIPVISPLKLVIDPATNNTTGIVDIYLHEGYVETGGIV